ncbi:malto-oligosyltrehalose trehalohydrolase [Demequina activiva]|uniref:Malto-oligosyltrehalose trehalohydrolase n=1 Tax=Demequina activiva TaxID=1582364 RepID=A0A919Q1U9_9MICO|nr:malto-oligosyltrehalose trehalohydrolase [Demequina activiva]GIG54667.1 malto-oligosyltrehalose trehalohydrolase [Demequina activiva]
MRLQVWAPTADAVVAVIGEPDGERDRAVLTRGDDGWWTGPEVPPGTDYAFEVDGEGPWPDPRSAEQPYGVHGPSRAFDPGRHRWQDSGWGGVDALGSVLYELHVGTFTPTGTLDAAIVQLPDLKATGIDIVELMPLAPFPGRRGWGYDGVSLYGVHEAYGGPEALQRFVDAAHRAGLGVCLDVVYNHLGPDGNYLSKFGPYFTDAHDTPWGWAVNVDQDEADGMRRFICDNALRWFEDFHVDCLRLDAVHEIRDDSPRHILAQLSDETAALSERLGRPLSLVAESDLNDARMVTPTSQGGLGMTAQWNDDVHHAIHAYLTGERHGYYVDFGSVEALDKVFRSVFWHDGTHSPFRGRTWGAPVAPEVDRRRFVVCASNHDQVGNRAIGDRPSSSLSPGAQATSLALVLLSPFTPMLFMGEEYGETRPFMFFTDHDEPLGSAVSEGRMSEFGGHGWEELYGGSVQVPDPQDRLTFLRSKLGSGIGAASAGHDAIRAWVADLMALRPLIGPREAWEAHPPAISESAPRALTLHGPVTVHANLTDAPITVEGSSPLATFGEVSHHDGALTLAPDAVAAVAAA